jgi:hypothetical protein
MPVVLNAEKFFLGCAKDAAMSYHIMIMHYVLDLSSQKQPLRHKINHLFKAQ